MADFKDKYSIAHYIPLVAVAVATLIGFFIFAHDKPFKVSMTVAFGVSYFCWGLIHHHIHKDLNAEIAIEYLVICIFGVSAVVFIL
ncbi:MAG: hypothetical protein UT39_C0003G0069 [Candidatus Woesebacteria bacterium GW2011_GWA1_39_21]|uniref:Uncharacterized protein n=1 Tax=Candidatus Woesebacteria bacterium GW2011_GWA1_39_21 TaxID=1618550 RepID=A0A0G0QN41_9BACT|nr:MAG: hypothetical protein UT39_C0003G0069 [Candidatus Woesebacteria bacterium GW2011_GWA1_39_21]